MADEFSIDISGIEETCAWLTAAPANIAKGAIGKALTAACVPVVQALEAHTPVLTGSLEEHLISDVALDANGRGGQAQVGYGKQGYIARMVEYGHRQVGHKPKKADGGKPVAAHPFMRPAAAESGEAAIEAFGKSLQESLREGIPGVKVA